MEYRTGGLPLPDIEPAVREITTLLAMARASGAPVIHIVQHSKPGSALCNPQGPFIEIIPELKPVAGEQVVVKSLPSAFANTDLDRILESAGRRSLIVGGFMTHMCVSTTVRAASERGYRCTVIAAATGSRDLPGPFGGVIPAAEVHRVALAELADRFAVVVSDAGALASVPAVQG